MKANKNAKSIKEEIFKISGKIKTIGIILSIIMVILGICLFINPIATSAAFIWIVVVGILIKAIFQIVFYFKTPKIMRNGFDLALGIMWVIICIILICNAFELPLSTTLALETVIAIAIGFVCIFSGINKLCNCNLGESKALMIFLGILEIICGIIVLSTPFYGLMALAIIYGIYLIVFGITTFVRCLAIKTK